MHGVRQTRVDQENQPTWDFSPSSADSETFSNYVVLLLVQRTICLANGTLGNKEQTKTFSLCSLWLQRLKILAASSKDKTLPEKVTKYSASFLGATQLICSRLQAQTMKQSTSAENLIPIFESMIPIVCMDPSTLAPFFESQFKIAAEYEKQGNPGCSLKIWNFFLWSCQEIEKKPHGKIYLPQYHLLALLYKINIYTTHSDKNQLPVCIEKTRSLCKFSECQPQMLHKMAFVLGSTRKTFLQNCLPALGESSRPPSFPLNEALGKLFEELFVLFSDIVVEYITKVPDPKLEQFQWQPLITAALSSFQSRKDSLQAFSYLEKALVFIREKSCLEAIKNISGIYYNIALTLHKGGNGALAVHPAQMSFDLYEEWCTQSDQDEGDQLFKREQFLKSCKASAKATSAPAKTKTTVENAPSEKAKTEKEKPTVAPAKTNPVDKTPAVAAKKQTKAGTISTEEDPLEEAATSLSRRLTVTKRFNLDTLLPFIRVFISKKRELFTAGDERAWSPSSYLYSLLKKVPDLTPHQIGSILQTELGFYANPAYFREDGKLIGTVIDQLLSVFSTNYPISRSRVLIQKAQQLYKEDQSAALKQAQLALKSSNEKNYGHDAALFEDSSFVLDTQAIVNAWTGMISRKEPNSKVGTWMQYLDQAISHWKSLLVSLKPGDESNATKFFSVDYTMQAMSVLSGKTLYLPFEDLNL